MTDAVERPAPRRARRLASAAALALVFGLAHTQAPLYYSNQHQYFLHGLARAGLGHLGEDWLANTADPTPVFSALVAFTHRYLHDGLFHVYFFLLLGLYAHSLVGIFRRLTGRDWTSAPGLIFITLLTLVHAGALRLASALWLGKDYPWYFQAGVAGQYVLGPGLQPSAFGVLLLAAIHAFLAGRPRLAVVCTALASVIHSTYLPASAFLTLAFMAVTWRREGPRKAVLLGAATLFLVLPVIIYDLAMFTPSSPEVFARAQHIVAHDRIPHHAQPARWFDWIAALQVGWIVLGIWLARRHTLGTLMTIPFALSAALTLIQVATGNDTLALLFPWRTSAILVPLATAVNLAHLATWLAGRGTENSVRIICSAVLALLAAAGVMVMAGGHAYRQNMEELPLLDYIRENAKPGGTYLLPVEIPKHAAAGRGVVSTSFTRPPKRDAGHGLISVDLQRFRLYTGAPIFVDFKSIPYKDLEVIEWWDRMQLTEWLYRQPDWSAPDVRSALRAHRITHIVAPARKPLRGAGRVVFRDGAYILYELDPGSPDSAFLAALADTTTVTAARAPPSGAGQLPASVCSIAFR